MTINYAVRTKITLVAIAAVAMFALSAPVASAGTYPVYQCHSNSGFANTGWTWGGDSWAYGVEGCTDAFRLIATGKGAGRNEYWQTPTLPAPLKFTNVSFISASSTGGGSTLLSTGFCTSGSVWYGECTVSDGGSILDGTNPYSFICRYWLYECNLGQFRISTGDGTKRTAFGNFFFYDITFTVNDPTAPGTFPPYSGTLKTSYNTPSGRPWNSGVKTAYIAGNDYQSGVKQVQGFADGMGTREPIATTQNAGCNYTLWQPCPTTNYDTLGSINTVALSTVSGDGVHTYTVRTTDAGGLYTDSAVTFYVDNTDPDQPMNVNADSAFSGGWQTTNNFDLSWTNGTEVAENNTQSGIAQVKVNVEPTSPGTQSDPAAVVVPVGGSAGGISATVNSVSGVTVPAKGQWSVIVSVVDRAGNESPVGAGGPTQVAIGWDDSPPLAPAGRANGWISRLELANGFAQEWTKPRTPPSAAPICGYAASINEAESSDPGASITVQGNVNSMQLPTNLAEGEHWIHLRSVTCSGVASPTIESVKAPVDLTDPDGSISGVDEGGWYNRDVSVGLTGLDALSGMTSTPDSKIEHGAYLTYSVDGAAGPPIAGDIGSLTVSTENAHELALSPVDFAGNKAQATTIRFGIDRTAPTGAFSVSDPERPTLLQAPISDPLSGIAAARIQVRSQADGDWLTLPTTIGDADGNATTGYPNATVLTARFPDTKLPRGTYAVRLLASDRATNELATGKRVDGSDMTISNPIRRGVTLSAGLFKAQRKCGKKKGVKCVKHYRGKVVFVGAKTSLNVGFKRGAVVQGVLADGKFDRLARQPLEIYTKAKGQQEKLAGSTSTRSDGSYVFKLTPGLSRTVRVYFPGTEQIEDAEAVVQLGTAAKISLKLSKIHAFTGQTVAFRGQVRSFDGSILAAGKLVVLQFYAMKKWRPAVAVAHTDGSGRFSVSYKFDGKRVKNRIVFRVFAPSEDGWGHTASASKRVTMKLN